MSRKLDDEYTKTAGSLVGADETAIFQALANAHNHGVAIGRGDRKSEVEKLRGQVAAAVEAIKNAPINENHGGCNGRGCCQEVYNWQDLREKTLADLAPIAQSWENELRAQVWEEAAGVTDGVLQRSLSKCFREKAASLRNPAPDKPEDRK